MDLRGLQLKDTYDKLLTIGDNGEFTNGEGVPVDIILAEDKKMGGLNYNKYFTKARLDDTQTFYTITPFITDDYDVFSIEALISIRIRPAGTRITAKLIFSVECDDTAVLGSDKLEVYNNDPGANFKAEIIEGNQTFTLRIKNTSGGSIDAAAKVEVVNASVY